MKSTKKGKAKPRLCPKCGSEMLNGFDRYKQAVRICPDCGHSVWGGHEEKVGGEKSVH